MPYNKPYYRPKPRYNAKTYANTNSKPEKNWHKQARQSIFGRRMVEKAEENDPEGDEDERQLQESPRPFSLADQDFNSVVRRYTAFTPASTTAELDMLNIDDVSTCAANRYSIEKVSQSLVSATSFEQLELGVTVVFLLSPFAVRHSDPCV